MPRRNSKYKKIYKNSGEELVEKAHVPARAQIELIMQAGEKLKLTRDALYNAGYYDQFAEADAEIDWSAYDPTRDSSFDYVDAQKIGEEVAMSMGEALKKAKEDDKEPVSNAKKESKEKPPESKEKPPESEEPDW